MALGGVVQERRTEEIRVIVAAPQQSIGHVQPVAAICDRHRVEQPDAALGKGATNERLIPGVDAGADVRDELPDPMHRSGTA